MGLLIGCVNLWNLRQWNPIGRVAMLSALIRFAFLSTMLTAPNLTLADERGTAADSITGGVAAPIGAIIGAGIPANGQTLAGVSPEGPPRSGSLTAQASSSADIRPRWVVFDFATGIKTIELADGSIHEELFEAEPIAQLALSTLPHAASDLFDPVATGSVR